MGYWAKRQAQLKKALAKDEANLKARLSKFYETEAKRLEKEIASYYAQFGKDNVIEYRKMMESLSDADKKLLFEKYDDFAKRYPEYAHLMPVRESIYQLDRLEGLQFSVQLQQLQIGAKEIELTKEHLIKNGIKALSASQEALGLGTMFQAMNQNIVSTFVNVPWGNGAKFSDRIWNNKSKLVKYINTDMAQGMARGDSYARLTKALTERFGKVSRNDAYRLIYTEGTYVMAESSMQPFTEDFQYYKISTVGDNKVCPICTAMAEETFEIEKRVPGENFPPFHPWCRCTFEIVVNDWDAWMDDYVKNHGGTVKEAKRIEKKLQPEPVAPKITTRAEADKLLTSDSIGFETVESSFKGIDDDLAISNTIRLEELEQKYKAIHKSINPAITGMSSGKSTVAYVANAKTNPLKQRLSLCKSHFNNKKARIEAEKTAREKGWGMPFADEYAEVYSVTHEYGHMIQNIIVSDMVGPFEKFVSRATTYEGKVKSFVKAQDKAAKECYNEIIDIAKANNPAFSLDDNLSRYGRTNYYEFFAEAFANSQCGKPNELGKAVVEWLKRKGF